MKRSKIKGLGFYISKCQQESIKAADVHLRIKMRVHRSNEAISKKPRAFRTKQKQMCEYFGVLA